MSSPPAPRTPRLGWEQWYYPGPQRVFTADEMARAGTQPWPAGIDNYVYVNTILVLAVTSHDTTRLPWIWPLGLALCWLSLAVAHWLWKHPTRKRLNQACWAVGIAVGVGGVVCSRYWHAQTQDLLPLVLALMTAVLSAWWMVTLFRVQQIEARLRELAEQDAALKLSTRLAAAQIQPHFLFNTLASLQHWVDTGDQRAAPLLRDFTGYLRATLPMFERDLQPLGDEMKMVQRYLAIMQARLGARLRFDLQMPDDLAATALPPGLVLTLVENAIAHGIEPQLRGGHVAVAVRRDGARIVVTVRDDGPGLADGWQDGVGLANTRRRLAQACPDCTLTLTSADPGCLATLTLTP